MSVLRYQKYFLLTAICAAMFTFTAGGVAAREITITDRASVIDAQTIVLRQVAIKIWGIVAPVRQEAGAMRSLIGAWELFQDHIVTCHLPENWGKGQPIGKCEAAGLDLGAVLVSSGFAKDCPAISGGHYRQHETKAIQNGHLLSVDYRVPGTCGRPVAK